MITNKQLLDFLARRHPEYDENLPHWNFLEQTYDGGREWFGSCDVAEPQENQNSNIFRYLKEGPKEYKDRVRRAYRFNHTREVTDLVQKYIFKPEITRGDDAPAEITSFWENVTLSGLDICQFMKMVSTKSSVLGKPWVFTDTTKPKGAISVADAKAVGARVYAYIVKPQDVLDIGYSKEGEILWVLIRTWVRDDENPILATGAIEPHYTLWTTMSAETWRIVKSGTDDGMVESLGRVEHNLTVVPGFPVDHVVNDNRYYTPGLIDDIAYLDRAVANYLSNLDAIIQDQTFSQLAIPAQAVMPGSDEYNQLQEMGTKRIFTYDGEGNAQPFFLSPDPKQAGVILTVINKIIGEIYHTVGMAGERTKQDNASGIDNSSGVAKAYDFERMNSLLTSKADSLEDAENKLVNMVLRWNGKPPLPADQELVEYPDTFDTRSLFDEFTVAERLALVMAPDTVRQEQMKQVIDKLFPRLAKDIKDKMMAELKSWPPALDATITTTFGGSAQSAKFPTTGKKTSGNAPATPPAKNAQTANRQGQNNTGA